MSENRSNKGMAEPPEGVIAGESVPKGSEPDNYDEAKIKETMGALKSQGPPFIHMNETELREKAIAFLRKYGADL